MQKTTKSNPPSRGVGIRNISDYSPFGVLLKERTVESADFRRGFQGQEHDDEVKGDGNSVNYKYRMHDPRVGRFFAVDPISANYPWNSPYAFSENRLIDGVELEGLEIYYTSQGELIGKFGENTELRLVYDEDIEAAKFIIDNQTNGILPIKEMNDHLYNSGSSPASRSVDELAVEWGMRNNESSISDKKESSSFIYSTRIDGKNFVGYTKPNQGTESSASGVFTITPKRRLIAMIHAHGNYLEDYYNNVFSDEVVNADGSLSGDIYTFKTLDIDGYVSTPNGNLLKYSEFEAVTVISHGMPADPMDPEACNDNTNLSSTPVILESSTPKFE